jgi:hypothetical protein
MRTARAGHVVRRRWLIGLTAAGLLMVPPAIAWACNPQAHINLNQTSFAPGSSITVYGSYFVGGRPITVSGPTGSTTATSSGGGAFATTLTAPSATGNYVINASKPTGGTASASFTVATPQAPPVGTVSPANPTAPSTGSSAPAKSPSFVVPTVHRSPTSTPRAVQHTSTPAATSTPASTGAVTQGGQTVFAGSVAATPVVSTPVVPGRHNVTARHGHQAVRNTTAPSTSQLTATSDLWSGFAPGQTASLTSGTAGGMSNGGSSSALTIGIGLLAFGLIALVAGLTGAEVRRRRATAGR